MNYFKAIALILMIASCNNGSNESDLVKNNANDTIRDYETGTSGAEESVTACYESINNKDTVFLSIFSKSQIITGSLSYNYYEKDKNKGTIRGNMHGDTLLADYIFMSEGRASVRQVAFLKQGSNFIEGYGEVEEQNGKMIFKDRKALSFSGIPLLPVNCTGH